MLSLCVPTTPVSNVAAGRQAGGPRCNGMQSESAHGGQSMSAPVYSWLLDPQGHIVHTESPRSHDEASFRLPSHNSGPWQLCFKQRVEKGDTGNTYITLSYFSVTEAKAAEQQVRARLINLQQGSEHIQHSAIAAGTSHTVSSGCDSGLTPITITHQVAYGNCGQYRPQPANY